MERIPEGIALTSSEAATLLAVHPSTVKRWCNDGELDSELTPGGHRRISIDAAMELARDRGIPTLLTPFHPYEAHVWQTFRAIAERGSFREFVALAMQWARQGDFGRLERLILTLGRSPDVTFCDFCDRAVRGLLATVGREWEEGRMRVGDEHMVTQAVSGALLALRRQWIDEGEAAPAPGGPVAVVGTLEGNQHAVGALCIRMLLERAGWTVFYPGPDVPVDDFAMIQKSREASLVCISLPPGATMGDAQRALSGLRARYDRARPYTLAFGGPAPLAFGDTDAVQPFESVAFHADCASLRHALHRTRGAA